MSRVFLVLVVLGILAWIYPRSRPKVLVFTAAEAYRHASIDEGVQLISAIGDEAGFDVVITADAGMIAEEQLKDVAAVVFLNTSGDVLDNRQEADLERFLQSGGGFVGIHSALQTEEDWPWFGSLIGARYAGRQIKSASVRVTPLSVVDSTHVSTAHLPGVWMHTDEWYGLNTFSDSLHALLELNDPSSGEPSRQPVAWYHEYEGGRAFYTAIGHSPESFADEHVEAHLAGAIAYAIGDGKEVDYTKAKTRRIPEENRFTKTVLLENLDEPTEMEVMRDGKVLFAQRKGELMLFDPASGEANEAGRLNVHTQFEDGLMGLALDPNFEENHWIYLYYSPVGNEPRQHLSRFEFVDDRLVMESEVVLLEVATQRDECCHTGGSIEFDANGNLFLSTGDDVNPFASDGFGPIDERPGRAPWDGQGTSGNTNDLRGKILRIHPEANGSYSIPEGNLFPPDEPLARPEIYVMGNRNPYRISIDQKTGFLYWGEVGPDAAQNHPERGPRGHDEVNQARRAGNFGWPYFVGDNKAYYDYDFAAEQSGQLFDPSAPYNDSPNNTGLNQLPPVQKAFIWYPYANSPEFPIVGSGGRNAMAGPVFYADMYEPGPGAFPDYFDGKLFIYDWIRGWINVVTMNDAGDLKKIDPFMPSTRFSNPIDMQFDRNGVMYLLEYGSGWFSQNPDARLSRIAYNSGNRKPQARINADKRQGGAPLTIRLSAEESFDYDGDALSFSWHMLGDETAHQTTAEAAFTFEQPGVYEPEVRVRDSAGNEAIARLEVRVGNDPPAVELSVEGNRTFFWDHGRLDYQVRVSDSEDGTLSNGSISQDDVIVQMEYLEQGFDKTLIAQGHQQVNSALGLMAGKQLIEESDCTSCHTPDRPSIGPSYRDIAEKYRDDDNAEAYLVDKIIAGGGGVWGEQAMAAHPQLAPETVASMVDYILSIDEAGEKTKSLPVAGTFVTSRHLDVEQKEGMYFLMAAYTDQGGEAIGPTPGQSLVVLRHPEVEAESFDMWSRIDVEAGAGNAPTYVAGIYDGSYIGFSQIDLTRVRRLVFHARAEADRVSGGAINVIVGSPDGAQLGSVPIDFLDAPDEGREFELRIDPIEGFHDIYFVMQDTQDSIYPLFKLDWIRFEH